MTIEMLRKVLEKSSSVLNYALHQYWVECQDPRTKHLFLVDISPISFALIMFSYVLFAKYIGPQLMKNRKPMDLRSLMLIYNTSMVAINAFFFTYVLLNCQYGRRFLDFQYPDPNDMSEAALWEVKIAYLYWWSKFLDLLDTVFFVVRKKYSHISFLHLYHHTCVPVFGWLCLKHNAVMPATALFALVNSLVHTIMYSYYALSALGPAVRPYLWWKKYLTQLQLVQFMFGTSYGVLMSFFQTGYPIIWFYFGLSQPIFFLYLFYDFYTNSYSRIKSKQS